MTVDRSALVKRLERETKNATLNRLLAWLERDDTRFVSNKTSKVTVAEARRLWGTRLLNMAITGTRLEGIESLVAHLDSLAGQTKLEQFALSGPELVGNLFFKGSPTHQFVGAVIVESRSK